MKDRLHVLSTSTLFNGLSPGELNALAGIALERSFEKAERVFSEGDEAAGFYVVVHGQVKVFKLSIDGKEQILHIFGPGEPVGEVPVFSGQSFPAHAETISKARLLFFPKKAFTQLIAATPSLALNMLAVLSRRLRQFTVQVEHLSLKEVPGRFAGYVLYLSGVHDGAAAFDLDISKGQLASVLGTIPETLSRIFAKMMKKGLIQVQGRRIEILDRAGLTDLATGHRRLT
ncbi:MAG: Crp/Fnr family transcriptional regulator [Deltaproteobacteria bacterium]|nr:Crp/Fnr family transcriptional regulator [Deltaproteobacteria bacterium]